MSELVDVALVDFKMSVLDDVPRLADSEKAIGRLKNITILRFKVDSVSCLRVRYEMRAQIRR
jgi:hypothetical protein